VHVHVTVVPKTGNNNYRVADGIKRVRDELKADATWVVRWCESSITNQKIWTKGREIQFLDTEDDLETVVIYVLETQDRMDRGE
jgi:hypothetical protein